MAGRRSGGGSKLVLLGLVILVLAAVVWGYVWYHGRTGVARSLASITGARSAAPRSGHAIPKPSAGAVAGRSEGPMRPGTVAIPNGAGAEAQAAAAPAAGESLTGSLTDLTITAKHKAGWGGGCMGKLELSRSGVSFVCPGEPGMRFSLAEIKGPHKDGFALNGDGRKYHFEFFDGSGRKVDKGRVEGMFESWWEKVRAAR